MIYDEQRSLVLYKYVWKKFYNNYKTLLKYFRSSYPYIVFTLFQKTQQFKKEQLIEFLTIIYILPYQEGCSSSFCLLHETLELTVVVKLVDFHQSNIYIPHNKEVTKNELWAIRLKTECNTSSTKPVSLYKYLYRLSTKSPY